MRERLILNSGVVVLKVVLVGTDVAEVFAAVEAVKGDNDVKTVAAFEVKAG